MTVFTSVNDPEISRILIAGGVGVLRTDTLYGLVACADNEQAVERIYRLKGRDADKSPIVLIDGLDQLYDPLNKVNNDLLEKTWPGPVSVIVPSTQSPLWIRRGNESVAYRMPDEPALRKLLRVVGPLVAPSANPQGMIPAPDISSAQRYFENRVDFYVDAGVVQNAQPSQLLLISEDGGVSRLR